MGAPHKYAVVIKHWADGGKIQMRDRRLGDGLWGPPTQMQGSPDFDAAEFEWRIKPEPEYPKTKMTDLEINKAIVGANIASLSGLHRYLMNIAILRAIEDGQVTIVEKP